MSKSETSDDCFFSTWSVVLLDPVSDGRFNMSELGTDLVIAPLLLPQVGGNETLDEVVCLLPLDADL